MEPNATEPGVRADLRELIALEHKARGFSFLPRQPVHSVLSGRHASRLRGRGMDFEEIRRYLPGDDVRSMDWRVTARTRKPHVRVYTEERDRPVLLVCDQRLPMFFGSRRAMKSVVAAEIAALAAWRVLSAGDRVGALVLSDDEIVEHRAHRSRLRVLEILGTIVRKNHALSAASERSPNPAILNEALARACRIARHDWLVVLVSDLHGADEDTERHATQLSLHNDVLIAFVHDPLERQMPEVGRVVVGQARRQIELDTSKAALRRDFEADFEERMERLRALSRARYVPVLPIDTDRPVPDQVRELLGRAVRTRPPR